MSTIKKLDELNFTFSLITQNSYKFYSLTVPSDVLADTCFVTTRYDDPAEGFQRRLDEKRAIEIANYVDSGFGTIPNAIVLSAQPEAELKIKPGGRALKFSRHPKAFLVIDGQHRVYGYRLAKSHLRVPVIIYQGLSRAEETRLFIDINTKQKPVPNELLLDIKHLADLEKDSDSRLRELFDMFNSDPDSVLTGLLSPHEKSSGKITRTTFNSAFSTVNDLILGRETSELFSIFNSYLSAFSSGLNSIKSTEYLVSPNVFKAIIAFFPDVASKVKDRFDGRYNADNFSEVLHPIFEKLGKNVFTKSKRSYRALYDQFLISLTRSFSL